jgi:hypothetical protein
MKTTDKSAKTNRNFSELISKLSESEILGFNEMIRVRGGDGNGSEPILVPPPPTIE